MSPTLADVLRSPLSARRVREAVVPKILALDLEAVAAVGLHLGEAGVPLIGTSRS